MTLLEGEKERAKFYDLGVPGTRHELGSLRVDVDGTGRELRPELQASLRAELSGSSVPELPSTRQ